MSSYKVLQIKLNPDKRTSEYCKFLQQESARVWNETIDYFWDTLRNTDEWLKENDLKQNVKGGQFNLHSQSIQSVVEQLVANQKVTTKLRKDNPDIKYPYKRKRYFRIHWKSSAIKVDGRKIRLSKWRNC